MKSSMIAALLVGAVLLTGMTFFYLGDSTALVSQTIPYPVLAPTYYFPAPQEEAPRNVPGALYECWDSDGGKNFNVKGNLIVGDKMWWDECSSTQRLVENFCLYGVKNQPQRGMIIFNCQFGCFDGACQKA